MVEVVVGLRVVEVRVERGGGGVQFFVNPCRQQGVAGHQSGARHGWVASEASHAVSAATGHVIVHHLRLENQPSHVLALAVQVTTGAVQVSQVLHQATRSTPVVVLLVKGLQLWQLVRRSLLQWLLG
jgi:hypothetical protein